MYVDCVILSSRWASRRGGPLVTVLVALLAMAATLHAGHHLAFRLTAASQQTTASAPAPGSAAPSADEATAPRSEEPSPHSPVDEDHHVCGATTPAGVFLMPAPTLASWTLSVDQIACAFPLVSWVTGRAADPARPGAGGLALLQLLSISRT